MKTCFPWQTLQWEQLIRLHRENRLAHGLLLSGAEGIGKYDFAVLLAKSLLCDQPNEQGVACGSCKSCTLFENDTHPDYTAIVPAEEGGAIRIDQIRELIEYLALHSHFNGKRIVLLAPAERMNTAAANSLLKTLEEPGPDTLLLLISASPTQLPATIRSRCQQIRLEQPGSETALDWLRPQLAHPDTATDLLQLASGAPLLALELERADTLQSQQTLLADLSGISAGTQDPISTAAEWIKDETARPVHWLYLWVCDMIRSKSGAAAMMQHSAATQTLQSLVQAIDLKRLYAFLDKLVEVLRLQNTSANKRLMLEGVLIAWANISQTR